MAEELVFENQKQARSNNFIIKTGVSPESVMFSSTLDSNFTLFSSASASVSVDRSSSFASSDHDDYLLSDSSPHLAGHEYHEPSSSGPDLVDPNKVTVYKHSIITRKVKAKVKKHDTTTTTESEREDENPTLDSARSSFSLALRECQDQRVRSEVLFRRADRPRPASLDLNNSIINATNSSPRFGVVKKSSLTSRRKGMPNYGNGNVGIQKGWSSERVPLHRNSNRKHMGSALLPLNNGRTLPSKWEDAERWILSPVSGDGVLRPSFQQPQRRPKSKSGPLGPPGVACYSLYSPAVPVLEGGNVGNLMIGSPFSAGVMAADGFTIQCGEGHGGSGNFPQRTDRCMGRSVSVHGCSQLLSQSSLPGSRDEKFDYVVDAATNISRAVSRRDMATQMSPEGSPHSSPEGRPSFCQTPSLLPIVEFQNVHSSKPEVRDVQVDERVTMTRWSRKHRPLITGRCSENVDEWKRKTMDVRSVGWEVATSTNSISKIKREEARITAWENLQKAKAEAAMHKLEMKLEKKRSSSMDKIMNKLRSAQRKAQDMRSSVLSNQTHQVARTSHKVISFRRTRQIGSLSGCFTCHAF